MGKNYNHKVKEMREVEVRACMFTCDYCGREEITTNVTEKDYAYIHGWLDGDIRHEYHIDKILLCPKCVKALALDIIIREK